LRTQTFRIFAEPTYLAARSGLFDAVLAHELLLLALELGPHFIDLIFEIVDSLDKSYGASKNNDQGGDFTSRPMSGR